MMAELWKGNPVAAVLTEQARNRVDSLRERGIFPALAIVRIGARPDDLAYERAAVKRCEKVGITVRSCPLPEDVSQEALIQLLEQLNSDRGIHGCLLLRPLPPHLDEHRICEVLSPDKDVDGITLQSLAGVFSGTQQGFPPCTAQACLELLDYYHCDLTGRRVTVVGRSLVIGKPVAMMLLNRNATVTICHTRTADLTETCRQSEVLVLAAGKAGMIRKEHTAPGQIVIDVGINVDEEGNLVGDADFAEVSPVVSALTPVPGGVGAVTTSVLACHVAEAAARLNRIVF